VVRARTVPVIGLLLLFGLAFLGGMATVAVVVVIAALLAMVRAVIWLATPRH